MTEFGWLYSPGWLGIYNGDLLGLGGFAVVAVATLCLALRKRKRA